MKRRWRNILIVALLTLPCAELGVRILGWRPIVNRDFQVEASPDGWMVGDSVYGLKLNPGTYTITLENAHTFTTTHTHDGCRKLIAPEENSKTISVFGCSFTYGYGVNDNETFTHLLQQKLSGFAFTNHAVPGYGNLQALMQLKELIKKNEIPDYAMLVYSKVHQERNGMANRYRRALKIGYSNSNEKVNQWMDVSRFLYYSTDNELSFVEWKSIYSHWWGRDKFALVHAMQSAFEREIPDSELGQITEQILNEFIDVCAANAITPLIINLDDLDFEERYTLEREVKVVNVNFDFTNEALTNAPYDSHPNVKGHVMIARKIGQTIEELDE